MNETIEIALIFGFVGAFAAGAIAYSKTHETGSFVGFFIFGLLIWPVAVICACVIKTPPKPPSWQRDPWNAQLIRWWDGKEWTHNTLPAPDAAAQK